MGQSPYYVHTHFLCFCSNLFDRVDSSHCNPVARDNLISEKPVTVQLDVTGQFTVGDGVGTLLKLENVKVHALALVREYVIGVDWTFGSTHLVSVERYIRGRWWSTPGVHGGVHRGTWQSIPGIHGGVHRGYMAEYTGGI